MSLQDGCVEIVYLKKYLYTTEANLVFSEGSDDLFFSLHAKQTTCINIKGLPSVLFVPMPPEILHQIEPQLWGEEGKSWKEGEKKKKEYT